MDRSVSLFDIPGLLAKEWFGLVSLFNGILTFMGYLMSKLSFYKKSSSTIMGFQP